MSSQRQNHPSPSHDLPLQSALPRLMRTNLMPDTLRPPFSPSCPHALRPMPNVRCPMPYAERSSSDGAHQEWSTTPAPPISTQRAAITPRSPHDGCGASHRQGRAACSSNDTQIARAGIRQRSLHLGEVVSFRERRARWTGATSDAIHISCHVH